MNWKQWTSAIVAFLIVAAIGVANIVYSIPRNKPITPEGCICVSPTTTPVEFIRGDVNLSGHLNMTDATIISTHIQQMLAMDYNADNKINEQDVRDLVAFIFSQEAALKNQILDPRSSGVGR